MKHLTNSKEDHCLSDLSPPEFFTKLVFCCCFLSDTDAHLSSCLGLVHDLQSDPEAPFSSSVPGLEQHLSWIHFTPECKFLSAYLCKKCFGV